MHNKIITIGREYGSGGREIGRKLAEKLGIPCYDKEIVEQATIESGLLREEVETKGEYLSAGGKMSTIFTLYNLYSNMTKDDIIWHAQVKVIKQFAEQGPCVIVGRCADYILRERDDVVNVFVFSDMDKRIERISKLHPNESPEKLIKDKDKKRAAYYKHFTEMEWGESRHYDICLNRGVLGIDKCVEILSDLL
ncbi:MAG: cytidylate kinase-like family protein [Oscillospiraceae bacterium]|nr:cytidylate kinase-like family protein [Oscillospiraceae bacterium]